MEAKMEQQRKEAKVDLAEMAARLEQQRVELTPPPPQQAITESQLIALQVRFEGLHAAKLLSDDELYYLENLVADWVVVQASMVDQVVTESMLYAAPGVTFSAGVDVHKLIKISAVTPGDTAFARQIRRKIV